MVVMKEDKNNPEVYVKINKGYQYCSETCQRNKMIQPGRLFPQKY